MSASLVGSLSAGALCPTVAAAVLPVEAQLAAALQGALALQVQAGIGAPPLLVQRASLVAALAALDLGIALGLPGVTFSVADAAGLVAAARLDLAGLDVLAALLAGPGMHVYSYSGGTLATLGADLAAGIASQPPPGLSPVSPVSGLLVGASPATWATISPFFGGF